MGFVSLSFLQSVLSQLSSLATSNGNYGSGVNAAALMFL